MDLEQLQLEADKDLKINDTELDLESLKTPQLHNKYMKHYTKFKLLLTRTEDELRTLATFDLLYAFFKNGYELIDLHLCHN